MKPIALFVLAAAFAIGLDGLAPAQAPVKTPTRQAECPVMGNPVNKKVYTDHRGKRVYFCCAGCIEKFEQDPEGYIRRMEARGVTFEKAPLSQARCPVMGTPVNRKIYTDYRGKRIYFCCKDCIPKFLKNPDKYLKQMERKGIVPADVPGAKRGIKGPRTMQGMKGGECGGSSCGAGAKKGNAECSSSSGKCSGEKKKAGCSGGGCGGK